MANGRLSNCSKCGNLFVNSGVNTCPQCIKKVEEDYKICADYLRENKLTNIYTLSEKTGVSVSQITRFVRDGRISTADTPNLGYPCEKCGTLIVKGRFCDKCAINFNQQVRKVMEEKKEAKKEENEVKQNTYYQFKDRSDK